MYKTNNIEIRNLDEKVDQRLNRPKQTTSPKKTKEPNPNKIIDVHNAW